MILYLVAIAILIIINRNTESIKLKHGVYTRFICFSIFRILKNTKTDSPNYNLDYIYNNSNINNINGLNLSMKISSALIFSIVPILLNRIFVLSIIEIAISLCFILLGFYIVDIELNDKTNKIKDEVALDFVNFSTKLALSVEAGLNVFDGWKYIVEKERSSYLYKQAKLVILKIETGTTYTKSLTDFSLAFPNRDINSFVSIILQNLKKGGEIEKKLGDFARYNWNNKKKIAKKKAESASAKMVLPLMLSLIGLILIVVTPAILLIGSI